MDKLHENLTAIFETILEEARSNNVFSERLRRALEEGAQSSWRRRKAPPPGIDETGNLSRKRNRRAKAVLDPFTLFDSGESVLRDALAKLDLELLKDILAEYGMDRSRLAIKWKSPERVIELIADTVKARAQKGHVFKTEPTISAEQNTEKKTEDGSIDSAPRPANGDESDGDSEPQNGI